VFFVVGAHTGMPHPNRRAVRENREVVLQKKERRKNAIKDTV